jgi:L-ascorbate metabolism protein UlaG (beta-lactamase superfamily)
MYMKPIIASLLFILLACAVKAQNATPDVLQTSQGALTIQPLNHASLVLSLTNLTLYADPTTAADYTGVKAPNIILITDIHGDHMDSTKLRSLLGASTTLIAPKAVIAHLGADLPGKVIALSNGEQTAQAGITIEAVPMYNLPANPNDPRHPKGRGNGYVLTIGGKKLYISGDTQGIPEMRALKNIDVAFVCMNLPYTMDIPEAVDAVLDFKPRIVYPYHYRGTGGLSDVAAFKAKVEAGDKNIEVRLRNWYPANAK